MEPDRDGNYVPDWQEDENYVDEAPYQARSGVGCVMLLAVLLAAAVRAVLKRR
jgi:hypothetical protein